MVWLRVKDNGAQTEAPPHACDPEPGTPVPAGGPCDLAGGTQSVRTYGYAPLAGALSVLDWPGVMFSHIPLNI